MSPPFRVVFDCHVLLQSLLSPHGPAGKLIDAVRNGKLSLFLSSYVLEELRDVASRPKVQRKYRLTPEIVEGWCDELVGHATFFDPVPHVFEFPRDPDDAHYIDLAIAAGAKLIVSRDQDLLSLRDPTTADGQEFAAQFPWLEILTPPEALRRLETSATE